MQPWQLDHQVLQADDFGRSVSFQAEDGIRDMPESRGLGDVYKRQLVCSLGWLIIRFCMQVIVAGAFVFEQLLDFFICFVKPVLVFSGRQANNSSRGFL